MLIEKILEILQNQAESTVDLFDIMTSSYTESYRKARQSLRYGPAKFKTNWALKYQERQKFYSLLNLLKREGLVRKNKKGRKTFWEITIAGLKKLEFFETRKRPSFKKMSYEKRNDGKLKIVIFDIPEKERIKRDWLRSILLFLDFKLLQKSVWAGNSAIPQELFNDLRDQKMLNYIHIFEVNKSGTIKNFNLLK